MTRANSQSCPCPTQHGGLHAGVAEDFPNGGGNRAYLFVIDAPGGPVSLFFQDSASAVDLATPIVVDGHDYGAPIENLRRALRDAGLESASICGSARVAPKLRHWCCRC